MADEILLISLLLNLGWTGTDKTVSVAFAVFGKLTAEVKDGSL